MALSDPLVIIPPPEVPPTPPTGAQLLAAAQEALRSEARDRFRRIHQAAIADYKALFVLLRRDDSASGGMTPAQKRNAFTQLQWDQVKAFSGLIANMCNAFNDSEVTAVP